MTTTNLGLELPIATSTNKIREDFNSNMELIDAGVQMVDAGLTSIAALTTSANKIIYTTASDVYATTSLSAFGITLIDDADASTARTTLGLAIGTNVQAYDLHLTNIAALAKTDSSLIVGNGTTWVLESGATLRTSIGLGSVENTALSTWVGTTNITTLGTVATGVWSGTVIGTAKGGTGIANNAASTLTISGNYATTLTVTNTTAVTLPTSGTLVNSAVATLSSLTSIGTITTGGLGTGAVIAGVTMTLGTDAAFDTYYRGASVLTRLAPNTAASNKFLRMIGTGTAGQAPSWEALGTSDIPDISATYQPVDASLTSISALTYVSGSYIALTAADTYTVRTYAQVLSDIGAANSGANSSITSLTGLTTPIGAAYGGTGVANNAASTLTISGNFATTLTVTEATSVTLPASGTLAVNNQTMYIGTTGVAINRGSAALTLAGITLTTPDLGTPSAVVLTNATGTAASLTVGTVTGFTPASGSLTLAGADALTLTTTADTNVTLPTTGTLATTGKLSQFAATTSAELAGVISDEIGAGKLRFDTTVTAKTTTALLTEAEAGTILVSAAGGAYTVTLPTAAGNTGLTYHFIKTDANYTLITLAANGAETFNYENSTSAPVATYARLNTYCAEVTVVSDGTNWQVIDEAMGQVPGCLVYPTIQPTNIPKDFAVTIGLSSAIYDVGDNWDYSTWISGTARATSASHLIDTTTNPFTAAMVGYRVKNTTDSTYAWITVCNSASDVTISEDIFVNTEGYQILNSKYVIPITGYYNITGQIMVGVGSFTAGKRYSVRLYNGSTKIADGMVLAAVNDDYFTSQTSILYFCTAGGVITMKHFNTATADTTDLQPGQSETYIQIRLISKS